MVKASPQATWLARRVSVRKPNSSAISAPASAATARPSSGLPVDAVAMKPAAAPTSIMPSTPRLSTPARSAISSPNPASSSGVAARSVATSRATRAKPSGMPHRPQHDQSLVDEDIRRQQEEQQHALDRPGRRDRQLHGDLQLLPAQIQQRHEEGGAEDAERMQPAHEGDDDGGEAIAR